MVTVLLCSELILKIIKQKCCLFFTDSIFYYTLCANFLKAFMPSSVRL